jgi:hypothetical protein
MEPLLSPEEIGCYLQEFKFVETELLLQAVMYNPTKEGTQYIITHFFTGYGEVVHVYYEIERRGFTLMEIVRNNYRIGIKINE